MSTFFRTALHFTNVPWFERLARFVLGAGVAVAPLAMPSSTGAWWAVSLAVGGGVAATGVVGFCPACYLVGRRLKERRAP